MYLTSYRTLATTVVSDKACSKLYVALIPREFKILSAIQTEMIFSFCEFTTNDVSTQ
jgi:hypothetical protein